MSVELPRPEERPGVVVLLSGGVDSAVLVARALDGGDPVWPLFVRQGFIWEDEELATTERFLDALAARGAENLRPLAVTAITAPVDYSVRWAMDPSELSPALEEPDETVFLPGRNLALLTQASIRAYAVGVTRVQLGILSANPFPDATDAFFRSFENTVREAMRWPVRIEAPFARMKKPDVIRMGAGLPLELTISCTRPSEGAHCGLCNKCKERWDAFVVAGMSDPVRYLNAIHS